MKLEYIGSAQDLVNCNNIRLVSSRGIRLSIDDIESYVVENMDVPVFIGGTAVDSYDDTKIYELAVDDDSLRVWTEDVELNPKAFDYIMIDDSAGRPVGFIKLDQLYQRDAYSIEKIRIELRFQVSEGQVTVFLSVDYGQHLNDTSNKLAHGNLSRFSDVATKSQLEGHIGNRLFTHNLKHILTNPNLVYKYSGKLCKSLKKFTRKSFTIPASDLTQSIFMETIIDSNEYLINALSDKLVVYVNEIGSGSSTESNTRSYNLSIKVSEKHHIGSNILIDSDGNFYRTSELLNYDGVSNLNAALVNSYSRLTNHKTVQLMDQDRTRLLCCKDPVTKVLMFYQLDTHTGKLVAFDQLLKKIFLNFNLDLLPQNYEIIYASMDSILLKKSSPNNSSVCSYYLLAPQFKYRITPDNVIELSQGYFTSTGERMLGMLDNLATNSIQFITSKLLCVRNQIPDLGDSLVYCGSSEDPALDLDSMDLPPDTSFANNIAVLSENSAFMNDYSLIELSEEYEFTHTSQSIVPKLKISKLFGKSGILNLHKILKDTSNLGFGLLNTSLNGSLLGYARVVINGEDMFKVMKL